MMNSMSAPENEAPEREVTEEGTGGPETEPGSPGALSPRQERALHAVMAHPTHREAAQAAGVSETTLWRYMQNKDFARRLREVRRASVTYASVHLQGASGEAVKILRELMSMEGAPVASRVSAARAVLDLSLRARVTDELQDEIERLKELVGGSDEDGEAGEGGES